MLPEFLDPGGAGLLFRRQYQLLVIEIFRPVGIRRRGHHSGFLALNDILFPDIQIGSGLVDLIPPPIQFGLVGFIIDLGSLANQFRSSY